MSAGGISIWKGWMLSLIALLLVSGTGMEKARDNRGKVFS
jgi:hypothetical protein